MKEKNVNREKDKKIDLFGKLKEWQKSVIEFVIVFVIAGFFFTHIILLGVVPSESMEPTLKVGDIAIVNGLAYIKNEPKKTQVTVPYTIMMQKPIP